MTNQPTLSVRELVMLKKIIGPGMGLTNTLRKCVDNRNKAGSNALLGRMLLTSFDQNPGDSSFLGGRLDIAGDAGIKNPGKSEVAALHALLDQTIPTLSDPGDEFNPLPGTTSPLAQLTQSELLEAHMVKARKLLDEKIVEECATLGIDPAKADDFFRHNQETLDSLSTRKASVSHPKT